MTASTSIVTLSRVMTGCGSIFVICSRMSMVLRTESTNGRMTFRPASAVPWNLPRRSMIFTCFCGTILIDFIRTISRKSRDDEEKDNHVRVTSRTMPSEPVTVTRVPIARGPALCAAQSSPPTFTRPAPVGGIDVVRDDPVSADELLRARRDAAPAGTRHEPWPQHRERHDEDEGKRDDLEERRPTKRDDGRAASAARRRTRTRNEATETSTIAATIASASQARRAIRTIASGGADYT